MFEWLIESKVWEWFFSGAGLVLGGWLITRFRKTKAHESRDMGRQTDVRESGSCHW